MPDNGINKVAVYKKEDVMDLVPVELDVDKYHNLGVGYLDAKKYNKAIKMFKKEIRCIPEDCLGYWFLAKTLRAMGKEEEARENYDIALRNAKKMEEQGPDMISPVILKELREEAGSLKS